MARNPLYPDALQPMEMQGNDLIGYKPTLADGWDYNAKAYNDWVQQQQADLVARGLNDPQTGWPTQAGWVDAAHQIGNSLLMGTTAPGIRAFHGSPHSFDKFQMEKIGTGEGAQAYGHGLYFAGDEGVAQGYRDTLSADRDGNPHAILLDGQIVNPNTPSNQLTPEQRAALQIHYAGGLWGRAANDTRGSLDMAPPGSEVANMHQETLDAIQNNDWTGRIKPYKGSMYEVNLNANPEHMLDWDKPLSEQHPAVQEALIPHVQRALEEGLMTGDPAAAHAITGGDAYGALRMKTADWDNGGSGAADAAAVLHAAGIPGIRYLDGQSRTAGEGTHNYVVFNPENIEILRKYGLAGLMAGGTAAAASDQ